MSDKWAEYRVPVPGGSEPEEEPAGRRSRWIFVILGLVIIMAVAAGAFLVLRDSEEDTQAGSAGTSSETGPIEDRDPAGNQSSSESDPSPEDPGSELAFPGRIAFITPNKQLGTVAPDGSEPRLLTGEGQFFDFPAWSPVGDTISAIGSDFEVGGVYVTNDESGNSVSQLYADREDTPIYLYWTPDGQEVSFITSHPDGLALQLVPADATGASQIVTTGGPTFFWHWTPDGNQVLIHTGFTARQDDVTRLAFISLDDEGEREVVQSGFYQTPAISHDGRYYAFGDADPLGRHWLSISEIDGNQQARLLGHEGVVAMSWNPTRNQLAFTSPASPALSFYGPLSLLDMDSGDLSMIVPQTVLAFFWAPDGRSLAYLTLSKIEEINEEIAHLSPGDEQPVSRHKATVFPDESAKRLSRRSAQTAQRVLLNLWVLAIESEEPELLLTFEPTNQFLNEFLPFFDQYALSHRLWSPDSKAIVLPLKGENSEQQIVVVPADGGNVTIVADGSVAFWSHH